MSTTEHHLKTIENSLIEARQPAPVSEQVADLILGVITSEPDTNTITGRLTRALLIEDRGAPIRFEDVKVGDKIRAVRTHSGITSTHIARVGQIGPADLFTTCAGSTQLAVIAHKSDDLYLLWRTRPAALAHMSPGRVRDKYGVAFMFDALHAYRDGETIRVGADEAHRPWTQASTLTTVEPTL